MNSENMHEIKTDSSNMMEEIAERCADLDKSGYNMVSKQTYVDDVNYLIAIIESLDLRIDQLIDDYEDEDEYEIEAAELDYPDDDIPDYSDDALDFIHLAGGTE